MPSLVLPWARWSWAPMLVGLGCLPDNPSTPGATTGTSGGATDASVSVSAGSAGSSPGGDPLAGGELLGCPTAQGCTMLLVSQTLDDRVEVFVPEHPDGAYRGTISVDLEPNECAGCGPGDNGAERLDEPFGLLRAGGYLHVLTGHYPTRQEGSMVSFPLDVFAGTPAGATVPVTDYFLAAQFLDPVVGRRLGEVEPIFLHQHPSGRVVVGVFRNDLFAGEDTWTQPGALLVIDPADPQGEVGAVVLDDLEGGACQGAAQVIALGSDRLAVACDGNEAVAMLDGTSLSRDTVTAAAEGLGVGVLCSIPGAGSNRRVRYLAPAGDSGVVVGEGPTPLNIDGSARLWHLGSDCGILGTVSLSDLGAPGDWQLGEVVARPAASPMWLLASGSAAVDGGRGIFVAYRDDAALTLCPEPVAGFEAAWDDGRGGTIEPFALAVTSDGAHLAVGAGPFIADPAGAGFGKVLWASLSGDEPCGLSASVVDLTDGGVGHAPAVAPDDPATFRRGPNVVMLQQIPGA